LHDVTQPKHMPALEAPAQLPPESLGARVASRLAAGVDATALGIAQLLIDRFVMPSPEKLPLLRRSADPLQDDLLLRHPERYFDFGPDEPAAQNIVAHSHRSTPQGNATTWELWSEYLGYGVVEGPPIADPVLVEHWAHPPGRRVASVVCLHGFAMGRPRSGAAALLASEWFSRGMDVALVTLPDHGARRLPGSRFSGERYAIPDVSALAEAIRQAIYEIRLAMLWLRERNGGPVGLIGLSLGGYLTALFAGLYDDVDFVVPMVAPVCMGDLAWRFLSRSRTTSREPSPDLSLDEMREAFWIHSPLAHRLRVPSRRALIVAGRADRVVPPEHSHALWKHWGQPAIHWFSGSHLAPFGRRAIVAAISRHLENLEILQRQV
jgi:pimeloyl-ACP methyl ester carboxylesterase